MCTKRRVGHTELLCSGRRTEPLTSSCSQYITYGKTSLRNPARAGGGIDGAPLLAHATNESSYKWGFDGAMTEYHCLGRP